MNVNLLLIIEKKDKQYYKIYNTHIIGNGTKNNYIKGFIYLAIKIQIIFYYLNFLTR